MEIKIFAAAVVAACLLNLSAAAEATGELPAGARWRTNNAATVWASSQAEKGGTFTEAILAFPLTLRTVGPDSNSSFRSSILGNQLSLISVHPNTEEIIPALATHWAFGKDKKTMYFKLDRRARWSDGRPVTADDYVFTLEFMRSKHIIAPWYNNYYSTFIDRVEALDDHTIAVVGGRALPEPRLWLNISPVPRHFYGKLSSGHVRKYNWAVVPNTGPYQIAKIKKGKSVVFERKKDWWAKDLRYFKGRYNADKIKYIVIRDANTMFEYFRKGALDSLDLTSPVYWHQKTKDLDIYEKGYVKKLWFHTDSPQPSYGFWLNQDYEIFKDPNVRHALARAINMDKLLKEALRGDYRRLHNQFTGYGPYTNKKIRARKFDIAKVEKLMKKSGWRRGKGGIWEKDGLRYSVKTTYSRESHTQRLVILKEEARKAGVELKLQRLDGSSAFKLTQEKKHQAAWAGYSVSMRPQYWEFYHSDNAHRPQTNNITNTDDKEMDKLIEAYRSSLDIDKRIELSKKIQEKIHEIGAYIPTYRVGYFRSVYWRWWKFPQTPATKVSGELFDPFGSFGGMFWLDSEERKRTARAMKSGETFKPETVIDTTFKAD